MKKLIPSALVALFLAACSKDPVPEVADPTKIEINGERMTQQQFLEKYCADQVGHPTCTKVHRAMTAGAVKSETGVPRF